MGREVHECQRSAGRGGDEEAVAQLNHIQTMHPSRSTKLHVSIVHDGGATSCPRQLGNEASSLVLGLLHQLVNAIVPICQQSGARIKGEVHHFLLASSAAASRSRRLRLLISTADANHQKTSRPNICIKQMWGKKVILKRCLRAAAAGPRVPPSSHRS